MKLYISPYQLQLKPGWNRSHTGHGCLIKLEDDFGNIGFSDLHPWDSLGDQTIETQISLLKLGKTTSLSLRSIELALVDFQARKDNLCLLKSSKNSQIENHLFYNSFENCLNHLNSDLAQNDIEKLNFFSLNQTQLVKIKIDNSSFKKEAQSFLEISNAYPEIMFRLDFNEGLSFDHFVIFWNLLTDLAKTKIQFCEDPIPWSPSNWQKLKDLGVPLAADRVLTDLNYSDKQTSDLNSLASVQYLVLKPAKINLTKWLILNSSVNQYIKKHNIKLVVTSYLDHPVGITHAYIEALNLKLAFPDQFITCGLFSMGAYENTQFEVEKNITTAEYGIGFNQLLESQTWIYCKNL